MPADPDPWAATNNPAFAAWVNVIDTIVGFIPTPFRRRIHVTVIRDLALALMEAARLSAEDVGDCECRTGGHRTGCRRAS